MRLQRDEIIEMARQVARQPDRIYAPDEKEFLYYFAKLVEERTAERERADEREACAKLCDNPNQFGPEGEWCAHAIRAGEHLRGSK